MAEFPVTLSALVSRVYRLLEDSAETDTITEAIASTTASSITVATPRLYPKGTTLEIEDELLFTTTDPSGHTTTVRRGHQGTTAATHVDNSVVRISPRFPRVNIKEAINSVLGNWIAFYAPQLVWDSSTAGVFSTTRDVYAVATTAVGVARVAYKPHGRTALVDVEHGPLQPYPSSIASTEKGVPLLQQGPPGHTVYVLYERPWQPLESDAATVPADFPAMMDSLIVEGAALYLLGWRMQPKHRLDETVFAREQSESVPTNFNLGMAEMWRRNWVQNMHRMQSMRAQPTHPRKVWR